MTQSPRSSEFDPDSPLAMATWQSWSMEDALVCLEEWAELQGVKNQIEPPTVAAVEKWRKAHPQLDAALLRQWHAIREMDRLVQAHEGSSAYPDIPDCTMLRELGSGGMSVVYQARQRSLDRIVAAKVLLNARLASPRALERLRREAGTVAALKHPGILEIYATGEVEHLPYLLLEYVDGGTLKERIVSHAYGTRRSDQQKAAQLVRDLAMTVDYMHQRGVIHRDLKPTNVLMTADGHAKIADFGLAKLVDKDASLTLTGETPGTPSYMAPEQARGGEVGAFCDIYALGAILYELLVGVPPFRAETSAATLTQVLQDEVTPLRRRCSTISRDLEAICLQCLKKRPDDRYHSARALADDLDRWLVGVPTHARPLSSAGRVWRWSRKRPALAALAAVILLAIATTTGLSLRHNRVLSAALVRATELKQQAEINEDAMRQQHYVATIAQAHIAWKQDNAASVLALLERLIPEDGQTDLRGFEWDYLWALVNRDDLSFKAHNRSVNVLRYFPDGQRIITGADEAEARIWDAVTGEMLHVLSGHQYSIDGIEFPSGADFFVTSSCDGSVRAWDSTTYEQRWKLQFEAMTDGLAVSADNTKLAVGLRFEQRSVTSDEKTVFVFEMATRECINSFSGHEGTIADLEFSPDGQWLACASGDGQASIWNLSTGERAYAFPRERHSARPSCVEFSRDGNSLIIGRVDGLKYWRFDKPWEMDQVLSNCGQVGDLAMSANGQLAVACVGDHSVRIRDKWNQPERSLKGHTSGVNAVTFSPSGKHVVAGAVDGVVKKWRTDAKPLHITYPHRGTAVFDPLVTQFAQCEFQKNIDRRTLEGKRLNLLKRSSLCKVWGYSATGNELVGCGPDALFVWDLDGDATARLPRAQLDYNDPAIDEPAVNVVFSADNRLLLLIRPYGIQLVDWERLQKIWEIRELDGNIEGLSISPDGSRFALMYTCGGVEVRQVSDGQVTRRLSPAHQYGPNAWPAGLRSLAFAPDGKLLAAGGHGRLQIWRTADWRRTINVTGITCGSGTIAISADGKTVAVGGNRQLRLYQVATGQEMIRFEVEGLVTNIKFSPDGNRLACDCGTADGKSILHVWNLNRSSILKRSDADDDPAYAEQTTAKESRSFQFNGPA